MENGFSFLYTITGNEIIANLVSSLKQEMCIEVKANVYSNDIKNKIYLLILRLRKSQPKNQEYFKNFQ